MKKIIFIFSLLLFSLACSRSEPDQDLVVDEPKPPTQNKYPAFQTILDSAGVHGAMLIFDEAQNTFFSNDFSWAAKGQLPASTFKIPNSLIALEIGIVENDSSLFKWDGQARWNRNWEQDLIFKEAFQLSCVPCYQEIARNIGPERMNDYLERFHYGKMQVDSSNIDLFWLEGASRITPFQQIDFLQRFFEKQLPISERTYLLMKKIMILEEQEGYRLSGKTGWSVTGETDNGWFVGFVEKGDSVFYFATNVGPGPAFEIDNFASVRKEVTMKALNELEIINKN